LSSRRRLAAGLLIAPAIVVALGVTAYPAGFEVWLSFTDASPGEGGSFIGLANYAFLLRLPNFHQVLANTAVFVGASTVVKAGLGLGMALALEKAFPGRRLVYGLLLLPLMFPVVMNSVAWYYMFSNVHGAINYTLLAAGLIKDQIAWLGNSDLAMASLVVVNIWHGTPLFGLLLVAGLRSIGTEVVDSATVDGAGPLQRFRHIVAPLLVPFFAIATLLSILGTFGDYAIVHLITNGGPANRTQVLTSFAFATALRDGNLGVGAAAALSPLPVYLLGLAYILRRWRA
jgi:multiple sugar transport system permease protein